MFVTFEGIDGAGKSTLMRGVESELVRQGKKVLSTREPGGTDFGQKVRQLLLEGEDMSPLAEVFLFLSDRTHHINHLVRPALTEGKFVLCDRHSDSTIVYQGYGRGLDIELLRGLNQTATLGVVPDLTLLLDLEPTIGLARQTHQDRLGSLDLEFFQRVRRGFLSEAAREPTRFHVLDACQSQERLIEESLLVLQRQLERRDA